MSGFTLAWISIYPKLLGLALMVNDMRNHHYGHKCAKCLSSKDKWVNFFFSSASFYHIYYSFSQTVCSSEGMRGSFIITSSEWNGPFARFSNNHSPTYPHINVHRLLYLWHRFKNVFLWFGWNVNRRRGKVLRQRGRK